MLEIADTGSSHRPIRRFGYADRSTWLASTGVVETEPKREGPSLECDYRTRLGEPESSLSTRRTAGISDPGLFSCAGRKLATTNKCTLYRKTTCTALRPHAPAIGSNRRQLPYWHTIVHERTHEHTASCKEQTSLCCPKKSNSRYMV